jgi:hypothetical protein
MASPTSNGYTRKLLRCTPQGQPRTYRLVPNPARDVAYRRLALSILRLDVGSLADELSAVRRARATHTLAQAA